MSIFKKFILFLLSFQEKMLVNSLRGTLDVNNKAKRRSFFQNGCLLSIDSIAEVEKKKIEEELVTILETCNYNSLKILEYVKNQGTEVCYIKSAKSLNSIGENEGFVYPQKGFKALYISLLVGKDVCFKTPEMFIITRGEINKYYLIYHIYNWYTFKKGVAGLDADSQKLLNRFLFCSTDDGFARLQLSEIYKLKEAVKQDKSAIEFVFKLCQRYDGAQKALEKLKNGGATL